MVVLSVLQMMNRTYLLRMLQRPKMGLRKSQMRRSSIDVAAGGAAAVPSSIRRSMDMDEVGLEIAIMKKMDHPNVVRLYEVGAGNKVLSIDVCALLSSSCTLTVPSPAACIFAHHSWHGQVSATAQCGGLLTVFEFTKMV